MQVVGDGMDCQAFRCVCDILLFRYATDSRQVIRHVDHPHLSQSFITLGVGLQHRGLQPGVGILQLCVHSLQLVQLQTRMP